MSTPEFHNPPHWYLSKLIVLDYSIQICRHQPRNTHKLSSTVVCIYWLVSTDLSVSFTTKEDHHMMVETFNDNNLQPV